MSSPIRTAPVTPSLPAWSPHSLSQQTGPVCVPYSVSSSHHSWLRCSESWLTEGLGVSALWPHDAMCLLKDYRSIVLLNSVSRAQLWQMAFTNFTILSLSVHAQPLFQNHPSTGCSGQGFSSPVSAASSPRGLQHSSCPAESTLHCIRSYFIIDWVVLMHW